MSDECSALRDVILPGSSFRKACPISQFLKRELRSDQHLDMDLREPPIEWVGLAQSLGMPARRLTDAADIAPARMEAMARGGPSLIDAVMQDGIGD